MKVLATRLVVLSFVFALATVSGFEKSALGACGDYLQHSLASSSHLPSNWPIPTCQNGNCGGQLPVSLPNHDKIRVDDRSQSANFVLGETGLSTEHKQLASESLNDPCEVFLEVSVPPPRAIFPQAIEAQ